MKSDQFDHSKVIGLRVSVILFWRRKKNPTKTGLLGKFSLFPNVYVRILTKSEHVRGGSQK